MNLSIEHRLTTLERQNRSLRRTLAALAIAAGLAAGIGAMGLARREPAPKVIEAQSFNVVDAGGKVRASLYLDDRGPRLRFLDENGNNRTSIGYNDGLGPFVGLLDKHENARVRLIVSDNGSEIGLCDEDETVRAKLSRNQTGVGFALMDAAGKKSVVIGNSKGGPSLDLLDSQEHSRLQLRAQAEGTSIIMIAPHGEGTVGLGTDGESSALEFMDKDKQTRAGIGFAGDDSYASVMGPNDQWIATLRSKGQMAALALYDDKHTNRVALGAKGSEESLSFSDSQDHLRMDLIQKGDVSQVSLRDEHQTDRVLLQQGPVQSGWFICDPTRAVALEGCDSPDGQYLDLGFHDNKGSIAMGTSERGSHMLLYDGGARPCTWISADQSLSGVFVNGHTGEYRAGFGVDADGPGISLYSEGGKPTWEAPEGHHINRPDLNKLGSLLASGPVHIGDTKPMDDSLKLDHFPAKPEPTPAGKGDLKSTPAPDTGKLDLTPTKIDNPKP